MLRSYLQSSQHISRADTVDSDVRMCPLNRQTGSKVSDRRLGCVVRCLGLRHIDDSTGHTSNHDDAAVCDIASHQVTGDTCREEVCAIDIDAPQLLYPLVWVCLCGEVLGEAGRGDQVVNLAVLVKDF